MSAVDNSRNSPLREKFRVPIHKFAEYLSNLGITANEVTYFGLIGNLLASFIVAKDGQKPKPERMHWLISTLIVLLPKSADMFDGEISRIQKTNNPIGDVVSDLTSEVGADIAIIATNPKARPNALLAIVTSQTPRVIKAAREFTKKETVSEAGNDIVSFFGSYVGRTVTTTVAQVIPEIAPQALTLQSAASTKIAIERIFSPKVNSLTDEAAKKSEHRFKILFGLTAVGLLAGAAVFKLTDSPRKNGSDKLLPG